MSLDLSTINFSVNTKPLEAAAAAIGELVTNVGKLDKAARDAAQTEAVLAKAAKLNADANLQNAKAQDVRLKSTITADKADQQATAAIEKKTKATEKATESSAKNVGVLQRQKDILEFQTQGFSKGQSSILAYGKAAGLAADDIGELGKVLETQRKLMGGDPFDKSLSGLKSLQNQYTELKESVRQYATDSNLTAKQARELARDKERLIEKMKVEGASFSEIRQAVRAHNAEYVNLATSYNKMTSAEDAVIKSRKEAVNATNYLTQADQKMAAALNTSNAAIDKAGTDSLVKYETALRKSGVSQDVATQKLATYKSQLAQVAAAEEKRRAQHLTRALTPQISDVVVSLWSGQNPLTVLLQQGSQVNDMFQLSGVAAADFGKTVKEAFSSMLPSILTVVKAVGGLLVDGFVAAGNAVSSFLAASVGMAGALDKLYMKMSENGPSKWGGVIQGFSSLLTGTFAVGIAVAVAGLVGLGIGLKQVISENDNLARSMAQSGASMAISTSQAFAYAKSMNDVDISTGKAVVAITEMAKAGNFASSDIPKVTEAAVNLNKYLGVSIEDTVKAYSKLKDEPVKAILDLAKASGNIPPKIIETIVELERQGEVAKATSLAMTARFENDKKVIEDAKKNLSGFSAFVIKLGETIGNFFSTAFKSIWYATDPADELQKNLDEVRKKIKDVSATLESNKSWGISGDPKLLNSLKEQERMIISQIGAQVRLRGEEEKRKFLNAEKAKDQEAIAKIQKEAFAFASKETEKTLSLEAFKKKFVDDKIKATGRQVELDKQTLDLLNKQAEAEYEKLHASGAKQTIKDLETEIDILNKRVGLTSSYNNELASLQRLRASGVITEQEYIHDVEELIKLQPFYIDQQKKVAEGQDLINKLLGKGEGLGKDYYDSMAKLEALKGTPGFDTKEIEAAQKALSDTTPFAKAMAEWFAKATEAVAKSNIETKLQLANIQAQNMELDHNLAMVGLSEEAQKRLTIEFTKQRDLMKASAEYEKIRSSIMNDGSYGTDENKNKALDNAASVYQATLAQINRKAVDDLFAYYTSKAAEAGKNSFGSFAEVLKSAGQLSFSNAVSSIGELINSFGTLIEQQTIYNKLRSEAEGDTEKLSKLDKAAAQNQMKSYGDITKSMKGFFKEGTKGYKALHTAEKVFRAFEMAMAIKNAAVKIAQEYAVMTARITGDQAATASAVASSSTIVAAKGAEASASAVAAVANQGTGDPYTAFPRIAAMIAIMAGLGLMVGKSGGSGVQDSNQGTGTVFGDSSAKSESINNSLGVLEEVNTLTMRYSAEMLKSLRSIENTLSGVTNIILRSNGMAASAAGIVEGTQMSSFGKLFGGVVGTVLGGVVGTLIGSVVGKLFGTKTTITGQGVMVQDVSYQDILAGNVEAGYYTDVNRKKKFLGVTTSSKNSTNYKADAELSDQFSKLLNGFVDTIKAAAPILGVSLDTIDNNLKDFVLKIGKIDLKGLKGDEIKEKLMSVFGAAGDDIAKQAIGGFEKYQQVGEGYLETIVRLASTVESVRGSLDTLNSAFVLSVDNAMELVNAFGDLDKLTKAMSDYNQSYYTEAERNATLQRQLTREFTAQNLKLPTTKEEYRKLVEAQDLNTEAGRKMYAFLLTLAPAFAEIADAASAAAEEASAALDKVQQIWKDGVQSAYDILEAAINAQIKILNEQAGASEATISKLKGIFDLLKSAISDLYGEVASTAAMQASQGYQVIRDAISTGNLPEQSTLSSAISAVRSGISGTDFVSQFEADKARLQFAADLNTLLGQTEEQLSTEELTLKAIKDQIAMLELTLANAKAQLDAINGVNSSVLSVADAIREFQNALIPPTTTNLKEPPMVSSGGGGGFSSGPGGVSTPVVSNTDQIKDYLNHISLEPVDIRTQMLTRGWTVEEIAAAAGVDVDFARSHIYKDLPAFADGGSYKGGMALVGEEGPELINFNRSGQVYTAGQTASMLSGGDVVGAIESLENRVTDLGYALQAIAINTGKSSRVLERVTPDGDSILISGSVTVA